MGILPQRARSGNVGNGIRNAEEREITTRGTERREKATEGTMVKLLSRGQRPKPVLVQRSPI